MLRKLITLFMLALMLTGILGSMACQQTGHATGEAWEETQEGADEFQEGFEEGEKPD